MTALVVVRGKTMKIFKQKTILSMIAIGVALLLLILVIGGVTNESADDGSLDPAQGLSDMHGFAVDIANLDRLYIANHDGLYLFENATSMLKLSTARDDYMGFAVHPTDPNIMFSSGHPKTGGNLGFQKSSDGGKTWVKVSDGLDGPIDFHAMAVDKMNPDVVYGIHGGRIQKSLDGGSTWRYVEKLNVDIYQIATGAKEGVVYLSTLNGLRVSRDYGESWTSLSKDLDGGFVVSLAIDPFNPKIMLSFSKNLGFAKSTDGGTSWSTINPEGVNDMVLFIDYSPSDTNIVYLATRSLAIYKSADGGESWSKIFK